MLYCQASTLLIACGRLLAWYAIVTALFRCPSSSPELTDRSPTVCKPYLAVRERVAPYVQPYYDSYAAPHVDKARPYVQQFSDQFYAPSVNYSKQTYEKYGAPQVDFARSYSQEQWSKILKPQIDAAQEQAQSQYTANVAPHVSKASAAAAPYYSAGRDGAFDVYNRHVLPTYEAGRPYLEKTYATGHKLAVDVGLPYAQSAWTSTTAFFNRILWPKLRILYGENVEPQLVRIGERLGRYRDGKKIQSVVDEVDSSSTSAAASSSVSSASASVASAYNSVTDKSTASATPSPSLTPAEEAVQTRKKIDSDLKNWQDKFAKAADKGTEDLKERVTEITARQSGQLQGVGKALLIELEQTSESEESKLRKTCFSVVASLSEEPTENEISKAKLDISTATRKAGLHVKQKAEALRDWRGKFDVETTSLVYAAGNSTLDVINSIRDLGLQEIGMRWANMEGVTYKDWSKYHDVKKTFDQLSEKVLKVAQHHPGLHSAKQASEDLESTAMNTAEATAKELTRLKEVGMWKIDVGDVTDDFSTKYMAAGAAAAARKVAKKASSASERVMGTSQGSVESIISEATERASNAASDASSTIIGTEPGRVEKASSQIVEAAGEASKQASEAVVGTPQPKSESIYSKVVDAAREAAKHASEAVIGNEPVIANEPVLVKTATSQVSEAGSKAFKQASEAVVGTPQPKHESIYSAAKENADKAASGASEAVVGTPAPIHETVASIASASVESAASVLSEAAAGSSSSASSVTSEAPQQAKKVYGGAMAQEVKGQKPILDDVIDDESDATYSNKMQSMISQAGNRYADITKAVEEALVKATSTQGTVESASSVANEQYLKALSAASSALYGPEQGTVESATSVAADKWSEAVAA